MVFQQLEQRLCLTTFSMVPHVLFEREPSIQEFAVGDIDGDQDEDVVSIGSHGILLHENLGPAVFAKYRPVAVELDGPRKPYLADMDQDGDLDILLLDRSEVLWVENVEGAFNIAHQLAKSKMGQDFTVGDVDGNGELDVVIVDRLWGRLELLHLQDGRVGQQFDTLQRMWAVHIADLDGDGDGDFVLETDSGVQWLEYRPTGEATELQQVSPSRRSVTSIAVGDFDDDGDVDIATVHGQAIWLHRNDGHGTFQDLLIREFPEFARVSAIDLDAEENLELTVAVKKPQHYSYEAARVQFSGAEMELIPMDEEAAHVRADIDGDGQRDFVASNSREIFWSPTLGGVSERERQVYRSTYWVRMADFDGDGDQDMLRLMNGYLVIEENQAATIGTWTGPVHTVSPTFDGLGQVLDVDHDGTPDIIPLFQRDSGLTAFLNTTSSFQFQRRTLLEAEALPPGFAVVDVRSVDLNGDTIPDLLLELDYQFSTRMLVWSPGSATGTFGVLQVLFEPVMYYSARVEGILDLDGDGDVDIAYSTPGDINFDVLPTVGWFEQQGGQFIRHELANADLVLIKDMDDDSDPDLVVRSQSRHYVEDDPRIMGRYVYPSSANWLENRQGQFTTHGIAGIEDFSWRWDDADLDGDGDADIWGAVAYENRGSQGLTEIEVLSPIVPEPYRHSWQQLDYDGDGDDDFITSAEAGIGLYITTPSGDLDLDGDIDRQDLDTIVRNFGMQDAAYQDGDVDLDGKVTFRDFLIMSNNHAILGAKAPPASE